MTKSLFTIGCKAFTKTLIKKPTYIHNFSNVFTIFLSLEQKIKRHLFQLNGFVFLALRTLLMGLAWLFSQELVCTKLGRQEYLPGFSSQ